MDAAIVKSMVQEQFQGCEVLVEGAGSKYDITVVGSVFAGLRPVQKQQLVYAALSDSIASGAIHAVNINTFTPEQWQA